MLQRAEVSMPVHFPVMSLNHATFEMLVFNSHLSVSEAGALLWRTMGLFGCGSGKVFLGFV